MGRSDYRGGLAPIRSASELSLLLPVPMMMIVGGQASTVFPHTGRSHMSPEVGIIPIRQRSAHPPSWLPLYIHWKQWEEIVVPLFEDDDRVTGWRGTSKDLGQCVTLMNDIIDPSGNIVWPAGLKIGSSNPSRISLGDLYACDPFNRNRVGGKTSSYLSSLMGVIYERAFSEGY